MSLLRCFQQQQTTDDGARWKRQNEGPNEVTNLIGIISEGKLFELYNKEGEEAVKNECKTLKKYLYNDGESPHKIAHEEYKKWRNSSEQEKPAEVDEQDKDYVNDELIQFKEHEACWKLDERGAVGETPLHLCFLNNTPIHLEIAKILLEQYPHMAKDIYEDEEYYGEGSLHFAVVHGDLDAVKLLIDKGADVNQRATGRFFLPEDQKTSPKAKHSTYEGYAYYGEYPLAFAACFEHESIYHHLLTKGADPNQPDSFGNTVLHMLVIRNKPKMYSYAVRHPLKKADPWIVNGIGEDSNRLTPLALANKLGRHEMFNTILESQKNELWRFSNVNCSIYPIHAVDSIGRDGEMNKNSSLIITINGETDEHVDMLQGGVLRQLLDEKWKTFIKERFIVRLVVVLLHLVTLTVSVALRPKSGAQFPQTDSDYVRFSMEILTILFCLTALGMQIREMTLLGIQMSFANLRHAQFKAIYLIGCLLQFIALPLRIAGLANPNSPELLNRLQVAEESMLIMSLPMTWTMILFFAKVTMMIGPLVNIVFVYIKKDLLPFLIIVLIAFFAFATSFRHMYKTIKVEGIDTFKSFLGSLMALFQFTLGEFEYDEFQLTAFPFLTMVVFILFMFVMPILLLNMLIAMMASTFEKLIKKSKKDYIHQWAKMIIVLERTFSNNDLIAKQELYSVKLENPTPSEAKNFGGFDNNDNKDKKNDYRGIMVIKTASKTKAKQRKDAVRNWKRTIRQVLGMIKEIKNNTEGQPPTINYKIVFPESDDTWMEAGAAFIQRRHYRDSIRGSVDLAAAVEQLADTLAVKPTG